MEAESSVGIDPKAQADSAAKYNSEAGPGARSESGSEFELWKSDAARARNRAACIVGTSVELVVGITSEGHAELEAVRDFEVSSKARSEFGFEC